MILGGGNRRGWPAGALLLVLAIGAAALPAVGLTRAMLEKSPGGALPEAGAANWPSDGRLLLRTFGVAALIGVVSAALALAPAWATRSLGARWTPLLLCPALLPPYAAYSAWGLLRAPGTWLSRLIASDPATLAPIANFAQATLGLALWAWPIAAIVQASAARRIDPNSLDAARQHGGRRAALAVGLRAMAPALIASGALVALVMLGSAVPLHLAQVETSAIAVWRRLDQTAGARSAWLASLPLIVIALGAGAILGRRLAGPGAMNAGGRAVAFDESAARRGSRVPMSLAAIVWLASTAAPLALFASHLREARSIPAVAVSLAPAFSQSVPTALLVGACVALLAAGASFGAGAPGPRRALRLSVGLWLVLALTPGVLIGAAIARAGAIDALRPIVESSGAVALAHVARFGALGVVAGACLARIEPSELRDLRRLEPRPFVAWLRASLPAQAPAIVGVGLAAGALSLHEIESAVMLTPPGAQTLAQRMLGMLHYLRIEELNAAATLVLSLSLAIALGAAALGSISVRRMARLAPLVVLLALVPACAPGDDDDAMDGGDIAPAAMFGEVGGGPGQFVYPRCLDADDHSLWVIDKRGQVQRLTPRGEPLASWMMPDTSNGFPVGVTVDPRDPDTVLIADTHCHRVMVYRVDGATPTLVRQWGSFGDGPGQFTYPTDVAVVDRPDGSRRIYVAEYGGNDRVSCFDEDGGFLFAFGEGEGSSSAPERIEFQRPQSIAWHAGIERLIVADAGNHRLGLFTTEGALDRWIGRVDEALGPMPGEGEGEFNYPYGLAVLDDGSVLVAEFGGSRVQRIDPASGRRLGVWGRPGREVGRLACPWGVASIGELAYVLDSVNHRVVAFEPTPRGLAHRP